MGNHDWYMAGGGFCPRSRSRTNALPISEETINFSHLDWLRTLPVQREIGVVRVVHGGWADPIDEYLANCRIFPADPGRSVCFRTYACKPCNDLVPRSLQPGPVGQPRTVIHVRLLPFSSPGEFTLHRVEYDMQKRYLTLMEAAAGLKRLLLRRTEDGCPQFWRPPD